MGSHHFLRIIFCSEATRDDGSVCVAGYQYMLATTGSDSLVRNFTALPGGFFNRLDAAFDHGNPGLRPTVLLFSFSKIIERLLV
jgi:hypothetical protein